ncbi:permease prefix domain 1-containing protein [Mediterraneibacter faecis]|uniref:permease prefix domain 1-containing protein n=1 Tax=Mediterraneibacter faecis TaxID=592978 RepID=UPI003F8A0905
MRREEYLHTLTEQIRCKMARGIIEQEINDHIEDQKAEFVSEGMSQTEAEEAAVREMGDPVEVGLEMDRIHRPTMAWGMIALIVGLSLAGYLLRSVMYQTVLGIEQSAGKTEELFWTGMSSSWHTSLELPALLLGLVLMIGICYMDYTRIAVYAKPILIAYQVLLFIGLQVAGAKMNGSTRFIIMPFGNIALNLIDLLWLTIPLFAAVLYSYRGQGYRGILKAILWMIIPSYFLIIRCQSLIAAMILEVVYCVVLAAAVYKGWFQVCKKAVLTGIGVVVVLIPVLLAGGIWCFGMAYQKERIAAIFSIGDYAVDFPRVNMIREMISGSSAFHGNPQFKELLKYVDGSVHLLASVVAAYGILAGIYWFFVWWF